MSELRLPATCVAKSLTSSEGLSQSMENCFVHIAVCVSMYVMCQPVTALKAKASGSRKTKGTNSRKERKPCK